MKALLQHIIHGKNFSAIEHLERNGQEQLVLVSTALRKGELEIVAKNEVQSIATVPDYIEKKGKVHLTINNDKVLFKKVASESVLSEVLVHNAFPNIDFKDFYYELHKSDDKTYIFLCRRSYIEALIEQYMEVGLIITSWSLGFSAVSAVLPFLDNSLSTIVLPSYELSVQEATIVDSIRQENPEQSYLLGGEEISNRFINCFGGVLRSYVDYDVNATSNFHAEIGTQAMQYKQQRFFQKGLPVALGILLAVFLINFLAYSDYQKKVDRLEQISLINANQRKILTQKEAVVAQKKKRFDDVISSASSSTSFFIDELMLLLPTSISLNELSVQPIARKIRANKEIEFEQDSILITGVTTNMSDFSSWISEIEQLHFVENTFLSISSNAGDRTFELKVKLVAG